MHSRLIPADNSAAIRAGSFKLSALLVWTPDRHWRRCCLFAVVYTLALWFAGGC